MELLEYISDLDCRRYKKDWGSAAKNERDWKDWLDQHQLEYKYQNLIRNNYLHHYHPLRAYDLVLALRRDHLLGWDAIHKIMKHITTNNKFVEVDKLGQDDERKFNLYLFPRFPINVLVPYSLLRYEYYEELRQL